MRIFCFKNSGGNADPDLQVQNILRQFSESFQHCASAGQYHARSGLAFVSCASNLISHEVNDLLGAGLKR